MQMCAERLVEPICLLMLAQQVQGVLERSIGRSGQCGARILVLAGRTWYTNKSRVRCVMQGTILDVLGHAQCCLFHLIVPAAASAGNHPAGSSRGHPSQHLRRVQRQEAAAVRRAVQGPAELPADSLLAAARQDPLLQVGGSAIGAIP